MQFDWFLGGANTCKKTGCFVLVWEPLGLHICLRSQWDSKDPTEMCLFSQLTCAKCLACAHRGRGNIWQFWLDIQIFCLCWTFRLGWRRRIIIIIFELKVFAKDNISEEQESAAQEDRADDYNPKQYRQRVHSICSPGHELCRWCWGGAIVLFCQTKWAP